MAALQRVVAGKVSIANPSTLPTQSGASTLIKYTPSQQGAQVGAMPLQVILAIPAGDVSLLVD